MLLSWFLQVMWHKYEYSYFVSVPKKFNSVPETVVTAIILATNFILEMPVTATVDAIVLVTLRDGTQIWWFCFVWLAKEVKTVLVTVVTKIISATNFELECLLMLLTRFLWAMQHKYDRFLPCHSPQVSQDNSSRCRYYDYFSIKHCFWNASDEDSWCYWLGFWAMWHK